MEADPDRTAQRVWTADLQARGQSLPQLTGHLPVALLGPDPSVLQATARPRVGSAKL